VPLAIDKVCLEGMSELAGFLFSVVLTDTQKDFSDPRIAQILSLENLELNTFLLFDRLMKVKMKEFYRFEDKTQVKKKEIPINRKSGLIFKRLVRSLDEPFFQHLESLKFQPIISCLKWVRLLFLREFEITQSLLVWDFLLKQINFKTEVFDFKNNRVLKEDNSSVLYFDILDFLCAALYFKQRENLMNQQTEISVVQVLQENLNCPAVEILLLCENLMRSFIRKIRFGSRKGKREGIRKVPGGR